jgi:hypothetical protein
MARQLVADGFEVTLLYWSQASRELQAVRGRGRQQARPLIVPLLRTIL